MNHSLRGVDVETLTSEWRKAQRYNNVDWQRSLQHV